MRTVLLAAAILFVCASILPAADKDESVGYSSSDHAVSKSGDKVAGHIGACLMNRGGRPVAAFGMTKAFDDQGKYTFFIVFKTGGKKLDASGIGGEVSSDGKTTKSKQSFDLGPFDLPITLETVRNEKNEITSSKMSIGDQELTEKGPRVVLVDCTGERPTYKLIQVPLPSGVPDLADEDEKTWPATLAAAIKQLKETSAEIHDRAD